VALRFVEIDGEKFLEHDDPLENWVCKRGNEGQIFTFDIFVRVASPNSPSSSRRPIFEQLSNRV
jgi:hypothetical protein